MSVERATMHMSNTKKETRLALAAMADSRELYCQGARPHQLTTDVQRHRAELMMTSAAQTMRYAVIPKSIHHTA